MPSKSPQSLLMRFVGGSRKHLIEALQEQRLVAGNHSIATKFSKYVACLNFKTNNTLFKQGNSDNHIYFILSGSVAVDVNGREIAKRTVGEHVGEMTLIDKTAVRSATVRALEKTVVARITEPQFTKIANKHPEIWRRLAVTLAKRLKERNKVHAPPHSQPVIFIGSSSEGVKIAKKIETDLSRFPFVPKLWTEGVFDGSDTAIESLMDETKTSDFAILVLTPDDVVKTRGSKKPSPRDNVIFELGLFMGALSRKRTFIVAPENAKLKIPTDLLGLTLLLFHHRKGKTLSYSLRPTFKKLVKLVKERGPI